MRVIEFTDFCCNYRYKDQSLEYAKVVVEEILPKLQERYLIGKPERSIRNIRSQLHLTFWMYALAHELSGGNFPIDFRNSRVLDLGCGAVNGDENSEGEKVWYEPWFSRALHELGSNSFSTDIRNLEGEVFPYRDKVDLLDPHSLDFLETQSFDYANAGLLFDANDMTSEKAEILKQSLVPQLERILTPAGVLGVRTLNTNPFENDPRKFLFIS